MNQKSICIALCGVLAAGMTACGNQEQSTVNHTYAANQTETTAAVLSVTASTVSTAKAADKKLNIVCTIFPEYDWVKQVLGDHAAHADITYLLDSGVDLLVLRIEGIGAACRLLELAHVLLKGLHHSAVYHRQVVYLDLPLRRMDIEVHQ